MSNKEIICVYQDCWLCGRKGERRKKFVEEHGLRVRAVSFASPEGRDLCKNAIFYHGITKMPFYTDGKDKYSNFLDDFIAKSAKKTAKKKKTTKTAKKKAEVSDGDN